MTWEPITAAEMQALLDEQVARLDGPLRAVWDRVGRTPFHIPCVRRLRDGSPGAPEPMFALARVGDEVLFYDDVEDEFGTATLGPDGVLRDWGTWGDQLGWALRQFRADASRPAG